MAFVWFCAGGATALLASALWRRLAKRPVQWAKPGIKIADAGEFEEAELVRTISLSPVQFGSVLPTWDCVRDGTECG